MHRHWPGKRLLLSRFLPAEHDLELPTHYVHAFRGTARFSLLCLLVVVVVVVVVVMVVVVVVMVVAAAAEAAEAAAAEGAAGGPGTLGPRAIGQRRWRAEKPGSEADATLDRPPTPPGVGKEAGTSSRRATTSGGSGARRAATSGRGWTAIG